MSHVYEYFVTNRTKKNKRNQSFDRPGVKIFSRKPKIQRINFIFTIKINV